MKESWELAEDFWRIEMNANELADKLEGCGVVYVKFEYRKQAATMLRQQQAEIEALKVEIVSIEKNTDYWVDKNNWIRNNEPVELTQRDILSILQDANSVPCGQPIWNSTEEYNKLKAIIESAIRYTHPAELTDEEIMQIVKESYMPQGMDKSRYTGFARAILRKAQEK